MTYFDSKKLIGFDTGPGNVLINDCVKEIGADFDKNGYLASKGNIDEFLISILKNNYFRQMYPKSLDRNHFTIF